MHQIFSAELAAMIFQVAVERSALIKRLIVDLGFQGYSCGYQIVVKQLKYNQLAQLQWHMLVCW